MCLMHLQQQLAAYVSWVNAQLKKKPCLKPITDLRRDLQDGVVLTQLIEIVGKVSQHSNTGGICVCHSNPLYISNVIRSFVDVFILL